METVLAEELVRRGRELRSEDVAERHRPAARLDDRDRLGCREVATPAADEQAQRLRHRLDGPQIGAGRDDDLGSTGSCPADRGLEVAHRGRSVRSMGDVVRADEDEHESR